MATSSSCCCRVSSPGLPLRQLLTVTRSSSSLRLVITRSRSPRERRSRGICCLSSRTPAAPEPPLDVTTDDDIPGLSECRLVDQQQGFARLYQVGEQDLALGFKFNAKGTIDCYEREMMEESLPHSRTRRREIHFNMVQGDFRLFQGKWSVQEVVHVPSVDQQQEFQTTLSYLVELEPKLWVPGFPSAEIHATTSPRYRQDDTTHPLHRRYSTPATPPPPRRRPGFRSWELLLCCKPWIWVSGLMLPLICCYLRIGT